MMNYESCRARKRGHDGPYIKARLLLLVESLWATVVDDVFLARTQFQICNTDYLDVETYSRSNKSELWMNHSYNS